MQLSIIIPVYNAELTLGRCANSVLKDSFEDFDIILVDDGSTDSCPQICDYYARVDARVSVIHKGNGGLSDARNAGMEHARGSYITFMDSDDAIQRDTLQALMCIIREHPEYDLLEYPVYERYGNAAREHLLNFTDTEYTDVGSYWFGTKAYLHAYAWNKIYKRELLQGITFPVGKVFEDIRTMPQILDKCDTIATTSYGLYYYNYNDKGITSTAGGKELADLLDDHVRLIGTKFSPLWSTDYYAHVLNIQFDVYNLTGKEPILPPLPPGVHGKLTLKLTLSKLLGIKILCQLNKYIHNKLNK